MDPGYEPCRLQKEQYFSLEQIIYYKKPLKTLNQKKKKKNLQTITLHPRPPTFNVLVTPYRNQYIGTVLSMSSIVKDKE